MAKLNSLDREACRTLRTAIDAALAKVASEYGMKIALGSGRFDSNFVRFKLECAVINTDGAAMSSEVNDFNHCAVGFGLKPEDLGKEFTTFSGRYKIVGCKPQSYKYPIIGQNIQSGKRHKFRAADVRAGLVTK